MKKFSRIIVILLVAVLFAQLPAFAYTPLETVTNAKRAAVYSIDADRIVYDKNSTQECSIASVAKIVTAKVVLEKIDDLSREVEITEDMLSLVPFDSSTAGLAVGEVYTYEQLLYCLLLPSGNDAAIALAVAVSGTVDAFSGEMNRLVAELGCENTGFVNPHGIDEIGQYSSASDLITIFKYCLEDEKFLEMISTTEYDLDIEGYSTTYHHTNRMMNVDSEYYYGPIKGSKTGTDVYAGSCLISYAEKNGLEYIAVVLGCDYPEEGKIPYTYSDTRSLLEDAFNSYAVCQVNENGQVVGTLPVTNMKGGDEVEIAVSEPLTVVCDTGTTAESFTGEIDIIGEYIAPLKAGTVVGTINYYDCEDKFVGSSDVVTVADAEYSNFKSVLQGLKLVSGWQYLLIFIGAIIVALIIMLLLQYLRVKILRSLRKKGRK